jgi:hemoglobin-like flavoprotein
MDPAQAKLVTESWERVQEHAPELATAFYGRLFQLDPRIKDLFALAAMESQGEKFMAMLSELVHVVEDPDRFEGLLVDSGRRHEGYGVVPRDYRTVGEALLWAIDTALPGGMDEPTRQAWAEAYTRMASIMQGSSREPSAHSGPAV